MRRLSNANINEIVYERCWRNKHREIIYLMCVWAARVQAIHCHLGTLGAVPQVHYPEIYELAVLNSKEERGKKIRIQQKILIANIIEDVHSTCG